jgi:hypothetical protein
MTACTRGAISRISSGQCSPLPKISDVARFDPVPKSFRWKHGDKAKAVVDMAEELLKLVRQYQAATG